MTDLSLIEVDETDPRDTPGAFRTYLRREVPWGVIEFEESPAGWTKKDGDRRLVDWRAYNATEHGKRRSRWPSVTTWGGKIMAKDLSRYGEEHGARGAHVLHQRGVLTAEHTEEDAVELVRANHVGVDAATDRASTRGIDVHGVLEDYMLTSRFPNVNDFDFEVQGYVRGLLSWLAEFDPEPIAVELLVAHPVHRYAGRLDLKARVRSECFPARAVRVVDLKTQRDGALYPGAHLQCAAYAAADVECGGEESDTPLLVVVDDSGGYDVMDGLFSGEGLDAALGWYSYLKPVDAACFERNRRRRNGRRAA